MRSSIRATLAALIVLCSFSLGHAVPQLINYQGILTDGGGTPISVTTSVQFRIWNMALGGSQMWTETQSVTPSADGIFNVLLGSMTPIPDAALASTGAYLGLTVSPDPEMSPRTQLVSVAYAYRPGTVDGATGGYISSKVAIGPGTTNTGLHAFAAGQDNDASGEVAAIGGGHDNTASGHDATVGGGFNNSATAFGSTISGGRNNTASNTDATVTGGSSNVASGRGSTAGGGGSNQVAGDYAAISGGLNNQASDSSSTVSGGEGNSALGIKSVVAGGSFNEATGYSSVVAGGRYNRAAGKLSVVGGGGLYYPNPDTLPIGDSNLALGQFSTIAGGSDNTAGELSTAVGGGYANTASGIESTVSGGYNNTASGSRSMIPGGSLNEANGSHSFAAGFNAVADNGGVFVWSDATGGTFTGSVANRFYVRASGGYRLFTDAAATTGVRMNAGAGAWASISDSTMKRNIRPVDGNDILQKLEQLPIARWHYETQSSDIEHIGPMAQDFYRLFGVGDNNTTITTIDPDGIALAAIKELTTRNADLETRVSELSRLVEQLISER